MAILRLMQLMMVLAALAQAAEPPRFLAAVDCGMCHNRIPEAGGDWSPGKSVGPYPNWQGSMMAHSSQDPYWKAKVKFEVEQAPARQQEIEDTCTRCHAPMQQYPLRGAGKKMRVADMNDLGKDGVSCTVCHQILAKGLGTESSFTGNFQIGAGNLLFGPHKDPFTMPMLHHTGFEPREAKHILDSALCGSCHTVITQPPGSTPEKPIRFVEQAPFLEWIASSYPRTGKTCQSCHMPQLQDAEARPAAQYIAHMPPGRPFPPTRARMPFGVHEFIGGNAIIPEMMARDNPQQADLLRTTAKRATAQLERALKLGVSTRQENDFLFVDVEITNLTGHKLPAGFPSRRLWIRLELTGPQGARLFESGGWDPASGELRAGETPQPHYRLIEKSSQVQIFETIALDMRGKITHSLLNSASHGKDNRILPLGFDAQRLPAAGLLTAGIEPVGVEIGDTFRTGSSRTVYRIPLPALTKGCRIQVEALYQTIKPTDRPASFSLPQDLARPVVVARIERVL